MADGISITLNVHDRGTPVVKKFGEALGSLFKKFGGEAANATGTLRGHLAQLASNMKLAGEQTHLFGQRTAASILPLKTIAATIATIGFGKLISDTVQTAQQMVGLETAFKAAAGGAQEGAAQLEFVTQQSERLGLEVTSTAASYKGLLAAVVASGRSASDAQILFTGVAEAARAMGLSNEEAAGTFVAVQQIMSKGKVSAEELRQQLGERFPVAIGLMAKTLNVTTAELDKMMEQGQLTADVMIPWAQELSRRFGPELTAAVTSSGAQVNRLKNTFTELMTAVGKGGLLDAVGMVSGSLAKLFKDMKESGAAKELGEAFKGMGEQMSQAIKEHGPTVVTWISEAAKTINENLIPALSSIKTTLNEALLGAKTSFSTLDGIINTAAEFWTRKLSNFVKGTADELKQLGGQTPTLDKLGNSIGNLADRFGDTAKRAKESGEASWKALNDSKAATLGVSDATKLTADEVRKLGEGARVTAGKVVDAGQKMTEAIKEPGEKAKETTGAISDLAKAYSELGAKSGEDMQAAAMKSVEAFQTIANEGNETKERLAELFKPVAKDIIDAFGKVPLELSPIFNEMKMRTGQDFRDLEGTGKTSAEAITDAFKNTGKAIGDELADGADKGKNALNGLKTHIEQRTKDIAEHFGKQKAGLDDWVGAWSGQAVNFSSTLVGLQQQFNEAMVYQKSLVLHAASLSLDSYFALYKQNQEYLQDIQARMQSLKDGSGSGDTGYQAFDEGTSRRNGSTRSGSGSAGGGNAGNDSLVLGSSGGGLSRAVGAGGGGAGTVIIEGATFQVNQNGLDPQAIDARGLVRAMLPSLREEIRRGELAGVRSA